MGTLHVEWHRGCSKAAIVCGGGWVYGRREGPLPGLATPMGESRQARGPPHSNQAHPCRAAECPVCMMTTCRPPDAAMPACSKPTSPCTQPRACVRAGPGIGRRSNSSALLACPHPFAAVSPTLAMRCPGAAGAPLNPAHRRLSKPCPTARQAPTKACASPQLPYSQDPPLGQALPQPLQWLALLYVSTHSVPHIVMYGLPSPVGQ